MNVGSANALAADNGQCSATHFMSTLFGFGYPVTEEVSFKNGMGALNECPMRAEPIDRVARIAKMVMCVYERIFIFYF